MTLSWGDHQLLHDPVEDALLAVLFRRVLRGGDLDSLGPRGHVARVGPEGLGPLTALPAAATDRMQDGHHGVAGVDAPGRALVLATLKDGLAQRADVDVAPLERVQRLRAPS